MHYGIFAYFLLVKTTGTDLFIHLYSSQNNLPLSVPTNSITIFFTYHQNYYNQYYISNNNANDNNNNNSNNNNNDHNHNNDNNNNNINDNNNDNDNNNSNYLLSLIYLLLLLSLLL